MSTAEETGFLYEEKMIVIMNRDIEFDTVWGKVVSKIYKPSVKFPLNRTLLFNSGAVWSAEVFLNIGTISPILTRNFTDEFKTITNFFIATARQLTNGDHSLANSIGFKLAIHTDRTASDIPEVFVKNTSNPLMGVDPPSGYCEFLCDLKFNSNWEIIKSENSLKTEFKSDCSKPLPKVENTSTQQPFSTFGSGFQSTSTSTQQPFSTFGSGFQSSTSTQQPFSTFGSGFQSSTSTQQPFSTFGSGFQSSTSTFGSGFQSTSTSTQQPFSTFGEGTQFNNLFSLNKNT